MKKAKKYNDWNLTQNKRSLRQVGRTMTKIEIIEATRLDIIKGKTVFRKGHLLRMSHDEIKMEYIFNESAWAFLKECMDDDKPDETLTSEHVKPD